MMCVSFGSHLKSPVTSTQSFILVLLSFCLSLHSKSGFRIKWLTKCINLTWWSFYQPNIRSILRTPDMLHILPIPSVVYLYYCVFVTLLLVWAMCIANVRKVKRTEFFTKQLYMKFVLRRSQHVLSYFSSQRHNLYLLDCVDLSWVSTGPYIYFYENKSLKVMKHSCYPFTLDTEKPNKRPLTCGFGFNMNVNNQLSIQHQMTLRWS